MKHDIMTDPAVCFMAGCEKKRRKDARIIAELEKQVEDRDRMIVKLRNALNKALLTVADLSGKGGGE